MPNFKKIFLALLPIIFFFLAAQRINAQHKNMIHTFTLLSKDIGGQATIQEEFDGFGCTGKNISPQLYWINPPKNTKSFALTLYDPTAPTGSGFWHWVIFNLPNHLLEIPKNAGSPSANLLPKSVVQSLTDFGKTGYGGPCPPKNHGIHQYIFTLYALDIESLDLLATTNPAVVGFNLWSHTIEKTSLVMYYKR